MNDRIPRLAGTFVGILVVVLLVASVVALASPPAWSESVSPYDASTIDPADRIATPPPAEGTIDAGATAGEKVVLVDMGHANAVEESDIQPLVAALVEGGHEVRFYSPDRGGPRGNLNASLAGADAFVSAAPEERFSEAEADGVADFADRGGRVLLLAEPPSPSPNVPLTSPQPPGGVPGPGPQEATLTQVSSRFDVDVGTGYLYALSAETNNFRHVTATPAGGGPLVEGVDRVVLERATRVTAGAGARPSLTATDGTQLSATREPGAYAVAVRSGDVAVVGDASIVEPGTVRRADNEVFVGNLAEFLVTGNKRPAPPDAGQPGGRPTPPGDLPRPPGDQPDGPGTPPADEPTPAPDNSTSAG